MENLNELALEWAEGKMIFVPISQYSILAMQNTWGCFLLEIQSQERCGKHAVIGEGPQGKSRGI